MGSFSSPLINVNSNIFSSSFVSLNGGLLLSALSMDPLSMSTSISCHLHLFASMVVLFYRLFQSTCYQCELQYLAIFISLPECWSYSMGSFNRRVMNVNSNILLSSFICLNADPILCSFQWTCYQFELQYLVIFIGLLECWSYSFASFNRPAINVNFNIFVDLNAGPILSPHSVDLLSM